MSTPAVGPVVLEETPMDNKAPLPAVASANGNEVENSFARDFKTLDANEAVAQVAYALNEVIAIYPHRLSSRT
jgi:hypothetical protein